MTTPPLTIRNLTPDPLTLKSIERFPDPHARQSRACASPFPSALKDAQGARSAAPSLKELGAHAQTFTREEVHVRLGSWEAWTLRAPKGRPGDGVAGGRLSGAAGGGGKGKESATTTTLRLTIENAAGERFRIDANPGYTQKGSHSFTPLGRDACGGYAALYHPGRTFSSSSSSSTDKSTPQLTITTHHLTPLSSWMSALPDSLPLSALSLPGTHNSHTYFRALPSVRCQASCVSTQLAHGIRFLDLRLQPSSSRECSDPAVRLVHGAFPVSLTGAKYLAPLLEEVYAFLARNEREAVVVSLKREGVGSALDEHLAGVLERWYIGARREMWWTGGRVPWLGEVRGKCVLLRRFEVPTFFSKSLTPPPVVAAAADADGADSEEDGNGDSIEYGIPALPWPHSTPYSPLPPHLSLQDFYDISTAALIPSKLSHCTAHLARAAAATHFIPGVNTDPTNPIPPGPLFLNFLSGSNFFGKGTWPGHVAGVINAGVERWICREMGLEEEEEEMEEEEEVEEVEGRCSSKEEEEEEEEGGGRGEEEGRGKVGRIRRAKRGDGAAGVVIMDMVGLGGDWDLVKLVVGLNMGVLARVREAGMEG